MSVCVLGSINWDMFAHVADLPRPGETILSHGLAQSPGGKGLNQAVAAARFGAPTRMIGALGKDAVGDQLRAFIREAGIDDSAIRTFDNAPTGQAFICLADHGENLIVVTSGSNGLVDAAAAGAVPDARVFLTQFETPLPAIAAFFRAARGTKILNAAPALMEGRHLLALADILIVNETELERFSGHVVRDAADAAPAARSLLTGAQTVIVTLGAEGALAVDAKAEIPVPGRNAKVVDTVGAGDCFCGVLAAALAQGAGLADAMRLANAAASIAVTRPGAAMSMPTRDEVMALA